MKTTLSDLVIAFLDLLEAEGRTLRDSALRLGWGLGLVLLAMLTGLVAMGFFLWGLYQYTLAWLSPPAAAMLMALLALILALLIGRLAMRCNR
ncbi:hypothetical protein QVG61_06920 [Thiohalobacter sp. IOR34]|uniref:hypothetical protein n=1 Tax=Thiohalobacter sp. IOR34 TaxID=3057176 RepID=UPI0025B08C1D|nr:hypothetical protein [Thiohalobacter sp. IOR34]WJW74256.1 hypothetical protein QVG61_06920 [Thiohalobacter sp. IOR34]